MLHYSCLFGRFGHLPRPIFLRNHYFWWLEGLKLGRRSSTKGAMNLKLLHFRHGFGRYVFVHLLHILISDQLLRLWHDSQ